MTAAAETNKPSRAAVKLTVETLTKPPPSAATYWLVTGLLVGTALCMAGLSYLLRRTKTAG